MHGAQVGKKGSAKWLIRIGYVELTVRRQRKDCSERDDSISSDYRNVPAKRNGGGRTSGIGYGNAGFEEAEFESWIVARLGTGHRRMK